MSVFQRQNKTLFYKISTQNYNQDVVLIHDLFQTSRWWEPLESKMSSKEVGLSGRLVTMDCPGYGRSPQPRNLEELSVTALASDHVAMIRALNLSDVHIVGHGSGALIALAAMREAPGLFAKAFLLSPLPMKEMEGVSLNQLGVEFLKSDRKRFDGFMATQIQDVDVHGDEVMQDLLEDAFRTSTEVWESSLRQLGNVDMSGDLPGIETPTLVFHGEKDHFVSETAVRRITELMPHAQFLRLVGRGHCPHIEDPVQIAGRLSGFFEI